MNGEINRQFSGFSQLTLQFLHDVRENNSKVWFEENKHLYQAYLLKPLQDLVSDLGKFMLTIDTFFEIRPKVDKTISRIYRDTRFSKDKSLFKNNMWITFKRPSKDWKDAPAYFFEIFPDWYRYGLGYYSASKNTMDNFRNSIDENPDKFLDLISFYKKGIFQLHGEKYKRLVPNDHPDEIQDWYQMKSFYLSCDRPIDDTLFSLKLVDDLIKHFTVLKSLYQYLIGLHHQ